ncbi:MAG: SpaA isopeptide-forming pilin-related protein, partial [Raoultibacter sp.]
GPVTSGLDGKVTFTNLPVGNYYVNEIVAPPGFDIVGNGLYFVAVEPDANGDLQATIKLGGNSDWDGLLYNIPTGGGGSGSFPFVKHKETGPDTSEPFAGVEFSLTSVFGSGTSTSVTSDADGIVDFTGVASGVYTLREVSGYGSYLPVSPIAVLVFWDASHHLTVRYLNLGSGTLPIDEKTGYPLLLNQQKTTFEFFKVDADDPSVRLAGAVFELQDSSGKTQYGPVTSDQNGHVAFEDLPQGTYTLVETEAPAGYRLIDPMRVVIGYADGSDSVSVLEPTDYVPGVMEIADSRATTVGFTKVSEDGLALEGAEFSLKNRAKGWEATAMSDAAGSVSFADVSAGTYTLSETKAPFGYEPMADIEVVVGYNSNGNLAVLTPDDWSSRVFSNKEKTLGFSFDKRDDRGALLSGIAFELRNKGGQTIASAVSDANGKVSFENILPGDYFLIENTPSNYRELDAFPLYVITNEAGDLLVSAPWSADYPGTPTVVNTHITTTFSFTKRGSTGSPLAGAGFELRDVAGKSVAVAVSDAAGFVEFSGLIEGSYVLVETVAPEGYQLIEDAIPVTVKMQEGQLIATPDLGGHDELWDKTIYNESKNTSPTDIVLKKVGTSASGYVPLAGATFRIATFYAGKFVGEAVSDSNGLVTLKNILPGTYLIEESAAPAGYTPHDPLIVRVYADPSGAVRVEYPRDNMPSDEDGRPIIVNQQSVTALARVGDAVPPLPFSVLTLSVAVLVLVGTGLLRKKMNL